MVNPPNLRVSTPFFNESVFGVSVSLGLTIVMLPILITAVPFFDWVVSVCAITCVDKTPNNNTIATCFITIYLI